MKKTMINSLFIGLSICMLAACGDKSADINVVSLESANTDACGTPWDGTATYNGGETVSSSGRNYTAVLWTQSQDPAANNGPSGSGQPWREVSICNSPSALASTQPNMRARPEMPKNPSASL